VRVEKVGGYDFQVQVELDRVPAAGPWAFEQFECVLLLLPFGAGSILGVYVTVLVTTSRICLTLLFDDFVALQSCE
jgi:hypothetical protein